MTVQAGAGVVEGVVEGLGVDVLVVVGVAVLVVVGLAVVVEAVADGVVVFGTHLQQFCELLPCRISWPSGQFVIGQKSVHCSNPVAVQIHF